jgi:hypothetical protein
VWQRHVCCRAPASVLDGLVYAVSAASRSQTALTVVFRPALYLAWFRVKQPEGMEGAPSGAVASEQVRWGFGMNYETN